MTESVHEVRYKQYWLSEISELNMTLRQFDSPVMCRLCPALQWLAGLYNSPAFVVSRSHVNKIMWLCVFRVGFSAEAIAKFVTDKTSVQVVAQTLAVNNSRM